MMEAMKAGLGGASSEAVAANRNAMLPASSRSSSDADDMTQRAQAALQSAKAAAVGGGADTTPNGTETTGSVSKRPLPENAKEEAMRQRIKEQLKRAQEEAATTAGT